MLDNKGYLKDISEFSNIQSSEISTFYEAYT